MSGQAGLRLAPRRKSVSLARAAVRNYAADMGADLIADAELLVSELVSNALQHGGDAITLKMSHEDDGLFVSVYDQGEGLPRMARFGSAPTSPSGRGLRIVHSVAASWGIAVDPEQTGKSVWFRLGVERSEPPVDVEQDSARRTHPAWMGSRWPRKVSLGEILDGIRSRLGADTATVLLVDQTRTVLEPSVAVGLDRTVRRAVRVPIGLGFAGRVAQTRQPIVLTDVNSSNVLNPVLLDRGVRSLLGVPIMAGSELLGVLHVGTFTRRVFDSDAIMLLSGFATDLAQTLRQQFIDDEHVAALTLQRSLLPTLPAQRRGIEIAARYIPAEGDLGGDWYDVFDLPGNRLGVAMGDVVGHGLGAAVVMGRLRSALRAYALEHDNPAEVLTRLDHKMCHFEPDALATVIFGVAREPFSDWWFSSAGHLAPLVARPDGTSGEVSIPIDPLLGLDAEVTRRTTRIQVAAGGVLCVFTDGLVERRPGPEDDDRDVIDLNVGRLREVLETTQDPERVCVRVLSDVVGDHVTEDDIAILVARRTEAAAPSSPADRSQADRSPADRSRVLWSD